MILDPLLASNIECLLQLDNVLKKLQPALYQQALCKATAVTLGGHVRHVLDHYDCLLAGLQAEEIDYNRRERDSSTELQLAQARQRIANTVQALQSLTHSPLNASHALAVRQQTTLQAASEPALPSSLGRELAFLHGHSIHHCAQIAVHMRSLDLDVDSTFGMAASSLEYQLAIAERKVV